MIHRRPSYYDTFHCLGGACPDTCCRDWSVVPDGDALTDYTSAPSPLRERIAQNLVTDEDGDTCFRLDEAGLCTLLTPDGLCAIQRDWGEAHLCAHCAAYPRFIEEYGSLTESSLAISCPEAARLLLEAPRFTLIEADDGKADAPFEGIDPSLLDGLEQSRAQILALLDGEEGTIWEKLNALLGRAKTLERSLLPVDCRRDVPFPPPPVPNLFQASAPWLLELLSGLDPLRPSWPELLKERAKQLAALSPADYAALRTRYEQANPRWERQLTNLACYFVFRHWHKAVNDDDLYGRAAFVCAACFVLYHLSLFQPGEEAVLWTRFSREVEHNEDNLSDLIWALSDPDALPPPLSY